MILKKNIFILYILLFVFAGFSYIQAKDITKSNDGGNIFANQALLNPVFEKLYNLEQKSKSKVNIVHIGDSHIQADFFTNAIRQPLQQKFGNGGFGFTFPYNLVKTNGPRGINYISNAAWQSQLNIYPVANVGMGLSGIALYTSADKFLLQLSARDGYEFNTVRIIYPTSESQYKMSLDAPILKVSSKSGASTTSGVKYHTIRGGENLSIIARRHGTSVAQIKRLNNLKSDNIRAGQRLKIATRVKTVQPKVEKSNIDEENIKYVDMVSKPYYSTYSSDSILRSITILPAQKRAMYNLNGFVLENNKPGVIYHAIGVNGAKLSDYNKYPLFFQQLPILQPDLIILSFGTNESFGRMSGANYLFQLREFVQNIEKYNPNAIVLVMTPPPSMFRRTRKNTYVADYSIALMGLPNMPVWDLYNRMGGAASIGPKGQYARLMARDKVHYTAGGYKAQGELFVADFFDAYNNYKKQKKN